MGSSRRALLVAALLVLLAATGLVAWRVSAQGYGEDLAGAFGAYPSPFASRPGGPPRLLAHYFGPVAMAGGVALIGPGNSVRSPHGPGWVKITNGVAAVNLRTDRLYWSYTRPGHSVIGTAAWQGAAYVFWADGLLARIDIRTARIRWHFTAPQGAIYDNTRVWPADSGREAVLVGAGSIDALDASTGALRWTARPPGRCQVDAGWPAFTVDQLTVSEGRANGSCPYQLRAYDLATGRLRWRRPDPYFVQPPVALGEDTLLAAASHGLDTLAVIDADSGSVVRTITGISFETLDTGDGLLFEEDFTRQGMIGAWEGSTGANRWREAMPHGVYGLAGPVLLSPDRVYVTGMSTLAAKRGGDGGARLWLLAYDASDGRLVSRTPLPDELGEVPDLAGTDAQAEAEALPSGAAPGLISLTETSPYQIGYASGDPAARQGWPTIIMSVG